MTSFLIIQLRLEQLLFFLIPSGASVALISDRKVTATSSSAQNEGSKYMKIITMPSLEPVGLILLVRDQRDHRHKKEILLSQAF